MCGIIGYTGTEPAAPILTGGLRSLEYRGYDSAGVTLVGGKRAFTVKTKGRIDLLAEKLKKAALPPLTCGIGHTRWATHGAPSDVNAHPHTVGAVALVHNGIIENYAELEARLKLSGYEFRSETDTEAAAALIDFYYSLCHDPIEALFRATSDIRGSYAFGVIFTDHPDKIYAVRHDSPLIAALSDSGALIASDVPAVLNYTKRYFRIPEEIIAVISPGGIGFADRNGNDVEVEEERVDWDADQAKKSGFSHFMLKEICEEPEAIRNTVTPRLERGLPVFDYGAIPDVVKIVACGTAMHAGLIGKALIERYARIPVDVEIASEFRYRDPILREKDLVILLSQSGETADTLAALRHARSRGVRTLAVVNVIGSSVAREADEVIYTLAGPEIAVASTKAYSVQCSLLTLLAVRLALDKGKLSEDDAAAICSDLIVDVPCLIRSVIEKSAEIRRLAADYTVGEHLFYIGRGIDGYLACEGSLKLKEISYIHSEAYAAGELKHGTISLITAGTPVIALITDPRLAEKTVSAIREVRSRGAHVLCITTDKINDNFVLPADDILTVPVSHEALAIFPAMTALQLFAYHAAAIRGLDVDKPRNLAKSVTVE